MGQVSTFSFEQDFINQTGNIASTTLFTPASGSNYIFTIAVVGATTAEVDWEDDGSNAFQKTTGTQLVFAVRAKGGQAITFATSGSSGTYSVYVTATQVGNSC